jgi:hypothetical protein
MPDFASHDVLKAIDPFRSLLVKEAEHLRKAFSPILVVRRVRYEVIVIRKHSPSLQVPTEITCDFQQAPMQNFQPRRSSKTVLLLICPSSKKISTVRGKLVQRSVGP